MTARANTGTDNTGTGDTPPATGDESQLGDKGKAALDAERAARKAAEKTARDQAAELQRYRDADKSEADKLAAREADIATREAALLRAEVATEKKLPVELAARLQGSTRDELLADADALAKLIPATAPTPPPARPAGGKPREVLTGGGDPTGSGESGLPLNGDPIVDALKNKLGIA